MVNMEIIGDFNGLVMELVKQLSSVCPTSIIAANIDVVQHIIKTKPRMIIDIFVDYILKYKPQIDKGDENFFINNTYNSEIGNNNELASKIFEFKGIWKQLNLDNKNIVIKYMQYLCQLALTYIE